MTNDDLIVGPDDLILVTGARGFIGSRVVAALRARGFLRLRCFGRPISKSKHGSPGDFAAPEVEMLTGNLLSREDCRTATKGVSLILHLAAGRGEKSVPDAYMNSVITTRNLLDAALEHGCLRRFVSISSFTVYTNRNKQTGRILDENSPAEDHPESKGDAYCFAKVKQDEIVAEYGRRFGLPYVIVRPGYVYGPGNEGITGRVGIGTFGLFLHLGGGNTIPFTYVDNCADAIVQAGLVKGVDGHVFNVVDDDLPTSRRFLRMYKKHVRRFSSLYVPHWASYALCCAWEKYSDWSDGQLPPVFNRRLWHASWKRTRYSNAKIKAMLAWKPRVSTADGMRRFFESCREKARHA
jgi:nucleoside-diphosphate-sugar epimerase